MDRIVGLLMGWRNIRDHTLRSTLTTLGVIIGVAAVITFVTLGASLQAEVIRTIAGENTDVVYVSVAPEESQGLPNLGRGGQAVFTEHDIEQLSRIDGVRTVVPEGGIAAATFSYRNDTVSRQWVTVTTPDYFDAQGLGFVSGRPFEMGAREVVLNGEAASMFEGNASVGDTITFRRAANRERVDARVVGIVSQPADSQGSIISQGDRPAVYAPADPFYERTVLSPSMEEEQRVYARVLVRVGDVTEVDVVQGRVLTYLRQESDARIYKPEGSEFQVTTFDQLVGQIKQVSSIFTTYITGIAVISLVVGAIGIANIMLVSVTERTREIGIMKAVGAKRRDILQLFVIEAVLLGLIGSVLGALVGLAGGYVATALIVLPLRFRPVWFLSAVVVGVLVGVIAGLYPAWRAARIDPIDALRHE